MGGLSRYYITCQKCKSRAEVKDFNPEEETLNGKTLYTCPACGEKEIEDAVTIEEEKPVYVCPLSCCHECPENQFVFDGQERPICPYAEPLADSE